ncbi:hypothetical protein BDR05DRAFT_978145 [Suillus weaverae]|nr:hypothetical protein BDR05DRAFT_978145 [Suillus weaverae]
MARTTFFPYKISPTPPPVQSSILPSPSPSQTLTKCLLPSAELTSPHWRPCSKSVVVVCSLLTTHDIDRILDVLGHVHTPSTRETYGSGLLVFHVFCDARTIPEAQHCPASSVLILAFIAACSGLYSGKTLANYFYAVQAWHMLHGQPWLANHDQCTLALGGGKRLQPVTSKWLKTAPFTVDIFIAIHSTLDLSTPLHAAMYTCLTMSFYTIARIGEFTVPSLLSFDPQRHVTVSNLRYDTDCHGFRVAIFHLPRTKTSFIGKDVYWAAQPGLSDHHTALIAHLTINQPSPSKALFSWGELMKCVQKASDNLGMGSLKAHGLQIGGTLEYLLCGVPFENVKTMGRWGSDTFVGYLWKHALVMAPFLQD